MNARIQWEELPPSVRQAIADAVGPVRGAVSQIGGFSRGMASILDLEDGTRVFAKVAPAFDDDGQPAGSADMYRREIEANRVMPSAAPAPRMRHGFEVDNHVVLLFDAVDGSCPSLPWSDEDLQTLFAAMAELSASMTPNPIDQLPSVHEVMAKDFWGWRDLAADPPVGFSVEPSELQLLVALESQ